MVYFVEFSFNITSETKKTLDMKVLALALLVCSYPLKVSRKSLIGAIFHGRIRVRLLSEI